MAVTIPTVSTIASVFNKAAPTTKNRIETQLGKRRPKITTMGHLYNESYLGLKRFVEDKYLRNWDDFAYERVAVELIPTVVDYLVEQHNPYGAHPKETIVLFVSIYLPKLGAEECISVWLNIQSTVWSQLGFKRSTPQRLAYRYQDNILLYHVFEVKEFTDGDSIFN